MTSRTDNMQTIDFSTSVNVMLKIEKPQKEYN